MRSGRQTVQIDFDQHAMRGLLEICLAYRLVIQADQTRNGVGFGGDRPRRPANRQSRQNKTSNEFFHGAPFACPQRERGRYIGSVRVMRDLDTWSRQYWAIELQMRIWMTCAIVVVVLSRAWRTNCIARGNSVTGRAIGRGGK